MQALLRQLLLRLRQWLQAMMACRWLQATMITHCERSERGCV
jgi:hypothetical protein